MFRKIVDLVNKGEEKDALECYNREHDRNKRNLIYNLSLHHINVPLAKFIVKIDKKEDFYYSETKAIDIIYKANPNTVIYFCDDLSQKVAEEWCSEHKINYYYKRRQNGEFEFNLELIDKMYISNFAGFQPDRVLGHCCFEYSDDLVCKLRKINERQIFDTYLYNSVLVIIKKEEDYIKILNYTIQEMKLNMKAKNVKETLFRAIPKANGFRIHPLTLELSSGNFDDYYYSNSIKELSESAMLYLIKTKKMTKQWAAMLSVDQIKFLAKNGFKDFNNAALVKVGLSVLNT